MDSFRKFMENNQYLEGGAAASARAGPSARKPKSASAGASAGASDASLGEIRSKTFTNLKDDGKKLEEKIATNTADDAQFRGDSGRFQQLIVRVKALEEAKEAQDGQNSQKQGQYEALVKRVEDLEKLTGLLTQKIKDLLR